MRRICILLLVVLVAVFVSCSNEQPNEPILTGAQTTTEKTTPVMTTPEETTTEVTTPEETTPEETTPAVTEPDFENNPDPDGTKRY